MTTVTPVDVRQRLGDILNQIAIRQDEYVIERKGIPLAAMISVRRLETLRRAAKVHLSDVLARKNLMCEEAAMALAQEAKNAARKA